MRYNYSTPGLEVIILFVSGMWSLRYLLLCLFAVVAVFVLVMHSDITSFSLQATLPQISSKQTHQFLPMPQQIHSSVPGQNFRAVLEHTAGYKKQRDIDVAAPNNYPKLNLTLKPVKIYVHDVKEWNEKILACYTTEPIKDDVTLHDGYGQVVQSFQGMQIRKTPQFALSYMFHQWLLQTDYVTLTDNQTEADLVFVHVLRISRSAKYCASIHRQFSKYWEILRKEAKKSLRQKPLFMIAGRTEPQLRKYPSMERTMIGTLEKSSWKVNNLFVVPYPSSGHLSQPFGGDYLKSLFNVNRTIFILFVGRDRAPNRRRKLKWRPHTNRNKVVDQMQVQTNESYVEFASGLHNESRVMYTPQHDDDVAIMTWLRHAVFCLQPAGDSNTRKSFYDAAISGCIPVIFQLPYTKHVPYPFENLLNYTDFSVKVPLDKSIEETLHPYGANPSLVLQLQENLARVIPYLQYNDPAVYDTIGHDAFTLILNEVQRRLL